MRLDHLLSKEYMSSDCSRDRDDVQTKVDHRPFCAKESIDHLDRNTVMDREERAAELY